MNEVGHERVFSKKNMMWGLLLIVASSLWLSFLFCAGPTPIGGDYSCLQKISSEFNSTPDAVVFFISYPFGVYFSYFLGWIDSPLNELLAMIFEFFSATVIVYLIRNLYRKIRAKIKTSPAV